MVMEKEIVAYEIVSYRGEEFHHKTLTFDLDHAKAIRNQLMNFMYCTTVNIIPLYYD